MLVIKRNFGIGLLFFFLVLGFFRADMVWAESVKQIKVVASFYPVYITAKNVLRDVPGVTVTNLTPPMTGCLHDYSVTTTDMKKLADADIFVANGAGMESFLNRILSQYPQVKIFQLAEGIPLIKGNGEEGDNPHVWVSITNAIAQVMNLDKAMEEYDPVHKGFYRKNSSLYIAKLDKLRAKMHSELMPYKSRSIITFHEAFPYFAQEFGLKIVAVVEREPGSAPSARELADTVDLVKKTDVAALFSEPQYPAMAIEAIARETGKKVYVLDPAVTGPDIYDAYIDIMEKNLKVLKEALR